MTYFQPDPPKPKRSGRTVFLIVLLCALFALCCGLGAALLGSTNKSSGNGVDTIGATASSAVVSAARSASAKPTKHDMTAKDIKLAVKTTKKACFGSAGCNVYFKINAALASSAKPENCDVTYQVNGAEDPYVGTLNFHSDGTYDQDSLQYGSTSSSHKTLSVKITDVDCS